MTTALVVGASRGIGLEFTRQYLAAGWTVFGTHRGEDDRRMLGELGAQTLKLDVRDAADVAGLAWQLDGEKVDVAVVNAGVYGPRTSTIAQPPSPEEFDTVLHTNVLAAMRLVPVLAPLLAPRRGTLAFVSSRMGSIGETNSSFGALYRVSKAALNMVAKLAHNEYGALGLRVVVLHPGWVRTDMGGPNADVEVATSVEGLRRVIADPAGHPPGGFFDYQGRAIGW